ncbi:hypothetical protein [Halolactibacillus sp. JCM 19043]|uniref:hypothetical protein n=1 Tax=Halolactibacillus sp. JCM 19043 TaxID=1460638 RepID=UPI0007859EAF|nr:hypothetical protein [Halolactibacillus sp. JCM 19043]
MNKLTKELLKKNNTREKAIFKSNNDIYTNMIVYLRGSDLTEYDQEVVRADIIELILDGQQRGDDIQKVMGGQYKEICDEIIEVMPKKTKKEVTLEYVVISLNALWILGVIALVKNLITNVISEENQMVFVLTLGDMINVAVIIFVANIIIWYVTQTAFEARADKKILTYLKIWLIATVILGAIIFNSIYIDTVVVSISLWLIAVILLLIFITGKMISGKVS